MKKRGASSSEGNAFQVLMKKRKTPKSSPKSSRFVDCPAGCGSHIPEHKMNQHLDSCLGTLDKKNDEQSETASHAKQKANESNDADKKGSPVSSNMKPSTVVINNDTTTPQSESKEERLAATISQSPLDTSNAFSHMMKQAHQVFTAKEPLRQRFHLHSDGHLSWTDMDEDIQEVWSSTVLLKASRMLRGESPHHSISSVQPRDVELTVSSSIPSATTQTRLVKRHSRLSVPVLKSILQKSVRRRRPLPAVRVAMELMDKAMGELLRRLPIILLEDSTLHPDLPLLVWAMVAESKDYVVPSQLMSRILCIVYEMTSCPWTDYIIDDSSTVNANDTILLSSPIPLLQETNVPESNNCELLLRSILLRAQYGGMAGDMKMLYNYVHVWNNRFQENVIPAVVLHKVKPSTASENKWIYVPTAIHERAKLQSQSRVSPLVQSKLEKLSLPDCCLAGVDFHCSSVLDHAIADDAGFERCFETLCKIVVQAGLSPVPTGKEKRRSYLMQTLKSCMWKFSSGINHRRPLCEDATMEMLDGKEAALKSFWDEALATNVETYTKEYVISRLAR